MPIKAFRFQLRLKPGTERSLRRFAGSCRWVWNAAIAEQQRRHEAGDKFAGHAAMCKWLTAWRHAPETAWLAETPIHPLQQTLRRLEATYQRFFAGQGATRSSSVAGRSQACASPIRSSSRWTQPTPA